MSSTKIRKYLAYYRKTLSEEPENIEARLRLAALFREMGRPTHAIEEYGTAAKLLASDGLPLEAIAACKAVLELDPSHQETQFFLARLYAQVPEATGESVRVARPLEPVKTGGVTQREQPTLERRGDGSGPKAAGSVSRMKTNAQQPSSTEEKTRESRAPQSMAEEEKESITEPMDARDVPRFDDPIDVASPLTTDSTKEVTKRERPAPPAGLEVESASVEGTRVQTPIEQSALRRESMPEGDRQSFEVGLFDMESLDLEDPDTGRWDDLDFPSDVEEPDTEEIALDELDESRDRSKQEQMTVERAFRVSALPDIPLFSQLPRQIFVEFLEAMEHAEMPAETEILRPGDPVSCLYVVVNGKVRVEKDLADGRVVELAKMGEGQVFGEFRLLTGKGGRARVVADTPVELLTVSDEVVYRIGRQYPEIWQVLWGFYYDRMLNHAMASSPLFATLNKEERELVSQHFSLAEISADDVLFARGDDVDRLSVIVSGSVRVEVPSEERVKVVDTLEEGDFVGVSPCAQERPATATARAATDVIVYQMTDEIFRELIYGLPEVAEAVRQVVEMRQSRTTRPVDETTVSDWI